MTHYNNVDRMTVVCDAIRLRQCVVADFMLPSSCILKYGSWMVVVHRPFRGVREEIGL